jgi:hypothetical protein
MAYGNVVSVSETSINNKTKEPTLRPSGERHARPPA